MNTRCIHRLRHLAIQTAIGALFIAPAFAGDAAAPAAAGKNTAVSFEKIAGSTVKRVILSAKAAERLDIQTGKVGQDIVIRKQTVSGMVIYPQAAAPALPAAGGRSFGGFGAAPAAVPAGLLKTVAAVPATGSAVASANTAAVAAPVESWVVVSLSPGEFERLAKDKPARITALYSRDKGMKELIAPLSDRPPVEDSKRSMLALHYVLPSSEHGLAPSTRVRVELQLAGSEDAQKVVPYNAVYYDAQGAPWVYVNTRPLTYERQRISVLRVVGNVAVLSDGPEVGTPVVTVGAALLYGTEIFGK